MKIAYMKNVDGESTEFWNFTYKKYIKIVTFSNDMSKKPGNCIEHNLC